MFLSSHSPIPTSQILRRIHIAHQCNEAHIPCITVKLPPFLDGTSCLLLL